MSWLPTAGFRPLDRGAPQRSPALPADPADAADAEDAASIAFTIVARNWRRAEEACRTAEGLGFVHTNECPAFVIALGGDGTYLRCEDHWPGLPKLLVRESLVCAKCPDMPLADMLAAIRGRRHRVTAMPKLKAEFGRMQFTAVNDIVVRNADPRHALRFHVTVDGSSLARSVIGDGIVAATPFGSTGYYRSVSGETLDEGMGLAFNNPTEPRPPTHVRLTSRVELTVCRGEAHLSADNHEDLEMLYDGDRLAITVSEYSTSIIGPT